MGAYSKTNSIRPGIRKAVNIAPTGSGNSVLVAAQSNIRYHVLSWDLTFSQSTNAKFTDGTNDLSGIYQIQGSGIWSGDQRLMHPDTNKSLDLNVSSAVSKISGDVWYEEELLIGKQTTSRAGAQGPFPEL